MRQSRISTRWFLVIGLAIGSVGWAGAQVAPTAAPGTMPGSAPPAPGAPGVPGSPAAAAAAPGALPEATAPPATAGGPGDVQHAAPTRVRVSSDVMAKNRIGGSTAVYLREPRAAHESGTVVLHTIVGRDGKVLSLQVVSGSPTLTTAALDAARTYVYRPYLLNGEPVEVDTTVAVSFTLAP